MNVTTVPTTPIASTTPVAGAATPTAPASTPAPADLTVTTAPQPGSSTSTSGADDAPSAASRAAATYAADLRIAQLVHTPSASPARPAAVTPGEVTGLIIYLQSQLVLRSDSDQAGATTIDLTT